MAPIQILCVNVNFSVCNSIELEKTMPKITKETRIRDILLSGPSMARILINNGLSPAHINANILDTLEEATVGKGMPEAVLENIMLGIDKETRAAENKKAQKPSNIISLRPAASGKIKELMKQRGMDRYGLRFGIVSSGCSTYTYDLDFEKRPTREEIVLLEGGVKIFVAKKSIRLLEGCTIDYIEGAGGFKIDNPNIKNKGAQNLQ